MCKEREHETAVRVDVDVTKIVKYVCVAGICIVGIIFGCNALLKVAGRAGQK